ncbi:MAG TPA: YcnI family protein [Microbacteriaceae bacterium]|nr:YcnI family protein [Microbacteriaceae bacterium]
MSKHTHPRARLGAIAGAAIALAAAGALVVASPAAAHVHVDGDAVPGSRTTATFRVPTESDTASTISITVALPTDTPITSVRALTKPGWAFEAERVDLDTPVVIGDVTITSAYGSISWTATGDGIAPGEYDEFVVQLGPVPDQAELVLPTAQGYSDGTVVAWDELGEHGSEAERPAPVLAIGSGAADTPVDGLAITGVVLGGLGLIAGIVALVLVAGARRRAG